MGRLKRAFMVLTEDDMGRPDKEVKELVMAELEKLYLSGYVDTSVKARNKRANVREAYDAIRKVLDERTVKL